MRCIRVCSYDTRNADTRRSTDASVGSNRLVVLGWEKLDLESTPKPAFSGSISEDGRTGEK